MPARISLYPFTPLHTPYSSSLVHTPLNSSCISQAEGGGSTTGMVGRMNSESVLSRPVPASGGGGGTGGGMGGIGGGLGDRSFTTPKTIPGAAKIAQVCVKGWGGSEGW